MTPSRSGLKRSAWRAGLCLLLGFVTTVAAAWALAAWLPHSNIWSARRIEMTPRSGPMLDTWECGRAGMRRREWMVVDPAISVTWLRYPATRPAPEGYMPVSGPLWGEPPDSDVWAPNARVIGREDARGWPMLALWCEFRQVWNRAAGWQWQADGGVLLGATPRARLLDVRVLPLRPLWSGLLANTGVYAVAWAVLLTIAGGTRRVHRRRAGRCTACAYDLRGLAAGSVCPECAAAGVR